MKIEMSGPRHQNIDGRILIHISGLDRPGITSLLSQSVATAGAEILDLGQSVLHGFLTLSAILRVPSGSDLLVKLSSEVGRLGLHLEVGSLHEQTHTSIDFTNREGLFTESLCLTILGPLADGKILAETTRFLAQRKINIRTIKSLTSASLTGIEFGIDLFSNQQISALELQQLRGELLTLANLLKCDIAIQIDDVFRHQKRLVCMDVDSTLIQIEVIDELARLHGVYERVAKITEEAMLGKLDFTSALRERVLTLKGLKYSRALEILHNLPLTEGAGTLIGTVKKLGFKVGLLSGGFDFIVDELKNRFHLDFAFSNKLDISPSGEFTGKILGTIVDAERKAQILRDMTQAFSLHPAQSIAVGDGANDRLMLEAAGLGIAFRAKPKLQAVAEIAINQSHLDSLLLLMGITTHDMSRFPDKNQGPHHP